MRKKQGGHVELTLKPLSKDIGRISRGGNGAIEGAVSVFLIGATRVHGKTSDAAGPCAATTAGAANGPLLLQGVVPDGKILVIASGITVNRGGALHGCGCAVVIIEDGTAALAGVPLFGKATCGGGVWLEELIALGSLVCVLNWLRETVLRRICGSSSSVLLRIL